MCTCWALYRFSNLGIDFLFHINVCMAIDFYNSSFQKPSHKYDVIERNDIRSDTETELPSVTGLLSVRQILSDAVFPSNLKHLVEPLLISLWHPKVPCCTVQDPW